MMNTKGKEEVVVVCVTGASGYIASYLVKILLLRGYTVHATLRNPNDEGKTEHLKTLEGANERLHLFKADLLEEGSFDSAINRCQGVFHTASPVSFNVTDPQREVLDPAQKGTLNVLAACKRSPTVKRVVFTSSMSSVFFTGVSRDPHVVVDESWFSKLEHCGEYPSLKWYVISKVLAEEAARNFCQENGIDMVSINPGMVIGPMLQPTLNSSVALIYDLINGSEALPDVALPWVHIKDVVEAHIQAFENPSAHGRYCLVESITHYSEIAKMLEKLYPRLQLSNKCFDISAKKFQVSKTKIKSLGIDYLPIEVSLKDTVENLKEKKYIHAF